MVDDIPGATESSPVSDLFDYPTGLRRYRSLSAVPFAVEAFQIDGRDVDPGGSESYLTPNERSIAALSGWMMGHGFREFRVDGDRRPFGVRILLDGGRSEVAGPGDYVVRSEGAFRAANATAFEEEFAPLGRCGRCAYCLDDHRPRKRGHELTCPHGYGCCLNCEGCESK